MYRKYFFFLLLIVFIALVAFSLYPGTSRGLVPEEKQPPGTQTRTTKFFVIQSPSVLVSPNSTTTSFTVFVGEKDPVIKGAFIEIRGVTKATAGVTISADINQTDSFPTSRKRDFIIDSTGQPNNFRLLYNGSTSQSLTAYLAGIIVNPGSYTFYFKLDISGADVSVAQARLILTYQFTPPSAAGGFPAIGTVYSPVFDTNAVNGATFNWLMAKGPVVTGTKVRIQFGTSATSTPSAFTFLGPDCTTATYYYDSALPASDTSKEIGCYANHNNKRYFRYKVILCSSSDCSTAGTVTPQVNDVIVNWSP